MDNGNMDDQFREMGLFIEALTQFDLQLRESLADMSRHHDAVAPYWNDEMRRHYDAQWRPLQDTIAHYDKVEGPGYVEFLRIRRHALERYIYGG